MESQTFSPSLRNRWGGLLRENRLVIAVELLLVILLALPLLKSRIILLLLLGWLSLWLRRSNWKDLGMNQPSSWWRTMLAGSTIAAFYQLFSIRILVPFLHRLTNATLDLSQFDSLRGNLAALVIWLLISWTIAAFGEEIAYRGYVLNRLTDLFGKGQFGWAIGAIISSIFFGLGHFYQGMVGIIETFVFGVIVACLYLASKRNLWLPIIFHGMNDTIGFLLLFLGLYP